VPGNRRNIGIVVPSSRLKEGVDSLIASTSRLTVAPLDEPQVAGRLEHHVSRAAGHGWLLVGDAIEFIDPLTGEGLHRALVTAALAARAVDETLRGDRNALAVYDRRVRSRFRSKNVFSLVLQAFIADQRVLDYALRRLDGRASLRDELTAVLADQVRATHALDPRFLARLLAP
jgi:flavin-dependent dehydrogenase